MKKFAVAAACLIALSANAQKKPLWPKEPTALFGVPMGAKLENERISECGGVKADPEKNPVAVCAMSRPSYGGVMIAGFPVDVFSDGFINREDEVVTSIMLNGKHTSYASIRALLVERYGKPQKTTVEKLQNKMGAVFSSEVLYWFGSKVSLTLHERNGTIDKTTAMFVYVENADKKAIEREKALKESASKM